MSMTVTAIPATAKFPAIQLTDNNLMDAINIIQSKNILVLYTEKACRIFHSISFAQEAGKENLDDVRVVYLNINSWAGLIEDGEWEYYIKANITGVKELGVDNLLRKRLIEQENVPNSVRMKLGGGCKAVHIPDTAP